MKYFKNEILTTRFGIVFIVYNRIGLLIDLEKISSDDHWWSGKHFLKYNSLSGKSFNIDGFDGTIRK